MKVADVGPLPVAPAPASGEKIRIALSGFPPKKTIHRSLRNTKSPEHGAFLLLRHAAIEAMNGRQWYDGPVGLRLEIACPSQIGTLEYLGGVMDSLGGSHGPSFIYLPIVYLDDCQVTRVVVRLSQSPTPSYTLEVAFLDHDSLAQHEDSIESPWLPVP